MSDPFDDWKTTDPDDDLTYCEIHDTWYAHICFHCYDEAMDRRDEEMRNADR